MSDVEILRGALAKTAQRRRWQRGWNGLWRGMLAGSCLFLLALALYKLLPFPFEVVTGCAVAAGVCMLAGFLHGWFRKWNLQETARWLDAQKHFQERLSTALELSEKPLDENWRQLVMADASNCAKEIDTRKLLPFSLPKASKWAVLVLALSAGLGFVPEYRSKEFVQREKDKDVIKDVGKQLADLTRHTLTARPPSLEPTHQSLEAVEQLGNMLSKNPVTRTDALKDLANVTDRLKKDLSELGKNPAMKPLERAARAQSKSENNNMNGDLQKQIDSLQKALGDKMSTPDALDKMKAELDKARQAATNMPDKDTPAGKAARQDLEQKLSDLAQQMRNAGEPMSSLEDAIAALKADQTELFLKDLNAATQDLDKLQEMAQTLQKLQQQAAGQKMGKDLAEQLKNGQAEQAQDTLKKMIDQLKSAKLSPEQMKKMLEEVSKAVDPASPYGKVADHLKQAVGQMQQGNKPSAAQSLANAADELKKLMNQMNDAQSLASTLEALKKAQMCVGNCNSWSNCKNGNIKAGKGGKPGRGVGTYANEEGWMFYPEISERWDNTGLQRPDMDPRGITDRGDGQLADNLAPTKLHGQISPGGPMPSITLKGVSIKGKSTVDFQEAATAAQSEAQSAMNQDQVPRAYRGAVRDYFDDLKK